MLNRSTSLAMSTSILKVLLGKLDIKDTHLVFSISRQAWRCQQPFSKHCLVNLISRHSPSILYISTSLTMSTSVLKALLGKLDIKVTHLVFSISRQASRCQQAFSKLCHVNLTSRHSSSILYISISLTMSTSIPKALPGKLDIKRL